MTSTYSAIKPHKEALAGEGGIEKVSRERSWTHVLDHIEYTPFQGILIFVEGGKFPKKGFPTPESVFAINVVKTLTLQFVLLYPFIFLAGKNRILDAYNKIANRALDGYRVKDFFLCKTAYAVYLTVFGMLKSLGVKERTALNVADNVAHIFEFDDAWRYRFQDVITEASVEELKKDPVKEIERVMNIYFTRDFHEPVRKKVDKYYKYIRLAFRIPWIRKAFSENVNLENAKFDEADWYWVCQRDDYLFGGKSYEERVSTLDMLPTQIEIHGNS